MFDGHITSLAAKYAEKHWLKCVFEAIEKEREESAKAKSGERRRSRQSSEDDEMDGKEKTIDFELEKALIRATRELERGFKEHGLEEGDKSVQVKSSGCFGLCLGGKRKVPKGGTP